MSTPAKNAFNKIKWWLGRAPDGATCSIWKPDVKELIEEIEKSRDTIAQLMAELAAERSKVPWGQEVPVYTFEQIRDLARKGRELKGADG